MISILLLKFSANIDIIALTLLFMFALFGFVKGFTKMFFILFGNIIALLLTIIISPPIVKCLENQFDTISIMANNISDFTKNMFSNELLQTKLSSVQKEYLLDAGLSGIFINFVLSMKNNKGYSETTTIGDAINTIFAYYIVLLITATILFILIKILLLIICKIIKLAHKGKSIVIIDRILGLFLGCLNGIFVIELIILSTSVLPFGFAQRLYLNMQASSVVNFIKNINILGFLTEKIIIPNISIVLI